jgi:hypothetical protein
MHRSNSLWTLIYEAKFAQESHEATVLELAHELAFKTIDSTKAQSELVI